MNANVLVHAPPAYIACGAKRTACLTADEMFTRKEQHLDWVCVANLTNHRVTLGSGWLGLPRRARSFPRRLLPGSGLLARGLRIALAHILQEIVELSAGVSLLTCPDRIPSSRNDLPHFFRTAHICRYGPAAYDTHICAHAAHATKRTKLVKSPWIFLKIFVNLRVEVILMLAEAEHDSVRALHPRTERAQRSRKCGGVHYPVILATICVCGRPISRPAILASSNNVQRQYGRRTV